MKIPRINLKNTVILILVIFSVFAFFRHKDRVRIRQYSDFHCYYVAGQRMSAGENIYVLHDKAVSEFRYSPFFALVMSGLSRFNEDTADTIWYAINFFLLIISFIYLNKMIIRPKLNFNRRFWLYFILFALTGRFIFHTFDSGQANILMLASITIGLYYILQKKEIKGGLILALSIMIKYTPLVFIPYFLLKKRFKLALIITAALFIYYLLPSLFIGHKTNLNYINGSFTFLGKSTILDKKTIYDHENQSLLSTVYRFTTDCKPYFIAPDMPFKSINLNDKAVNGIFLALAAGMFFLTLYHSRDVLDWAQLSICVILLNLNAWQHNFMLLTFGYFLAVYYLIRVNFKDPAILILLAVSHILNLFTIKGFISKTFSYNAHFYSPHLASALLVFFILHKLKSYPRNETFRIQP